MAGILDMDLDQEGEKLLRESMETWKEETYLHLEEEANKKVEEKLEELEVANVEYKEQLKEEFSDKLVVALDEMRDEIRADVIAEMVKSNPEIKILEQIKELIAPTLNEEYFQNAYADEIITLKEENDSLKERISLEEGAKTLAELLTPYSKKTQNIIISLVKPGDAESITEQFYDIIENLEAIYEEDSEEDVEDEEDTEEDDEDSEEEKPKKADFEDEEEFKKALKAWEKKQEKKDEEDTEEDDEDEDETKSESTIDKGVLGLDEGFADDEAPRNKLRDRINGLTR